MHRLISLQTHGGNVAILQDGKAVRTKAGASLAHPSHALMDAVKAEWDAQEKTVRLHTMPLTRLLYAVCDMDSAERERMRAGISPYVNGDTLRYHAPPGSALEAEQTMRWGQWLNWAQVHFKVPLSVTHGINALEGCGMLDAEVRRWVDTLDDISLLAMYALTHTLASFVLAGALVLDALSPEEAMELAWLEQDYQMRRWGAEPEAAAKRALCLEEVRSVYRFLALARDAGYSVTEKL